MGPTMEMPVSGWPKRTSDIADSKNFWIAAAGVSGVIAALLIPPTAAAVSAATPDAGQAVRFGFGVFFAVVAVGAFFWALVLHVAHRHFESHLASTPSSAALGSNKAKSSRKPATKPPGPTNEPSRPLDETTSPSGAQALDAERLVGYFTGRTDVQAQALIAPWIGAEVVYHGTVKNADHEYVMTDITDHILGILYFEPKSTGRLARLHMGDEFTVVGLVDRVSGAAGGTVVLRGCRFVD